MFRGLLGVLQERIKRLQINCADNLIFYKRRADLQMMYPALLKSIQRPSFRGIHMSRRALQSVGLNMVISPEEIDKVLDKLNTLPEKELFNYTSKKMSRMIVKFRNEKGLFERVEQLLNLEKVEKRHIQKMCDSMLLTGLSPMLLNQDNNSNKSLSRKLFGSIIPKPDINKFEDSLDTTFVGLHLSLQGIGYSMKLNDELLEWKIVDLPILEIEKAQKTKNSIKIVDPSATAYFEHKNLFDSCQIIAEKLPKADYYIVEEPAPIFQKDPYMKAKINLMNLRTTLLTILKARNATIHALKTNVPDILFNLKQGNESISVQEKVKVNYSDKLVTMKILDEKVDQEILLHDSDKKYFEEASRVNKEYLLLSLLKTVAFEYLCKEIMGI